MVAVYSLKKGQKTIEGRFSSITKTKRKKCRESQFVPTEIVISGLLGNRKYEYEFVFDWMSKHDWKKRIKDVDFVEISKLSGRGWYDAFQPLFQNKWNNAISGLIPQVRDVLTQELDASRTRLSFPREWTALRRFRPEWLGLSRRS